MSKEVQTIEEKAGEILTEIFSQVSSVQDMYGPPHSHELVKQVLIGYVATCVHAALTAHENDHHLSDEFRAQAVMNQLELTKQAIQESVSEGFTAAYQAWAGLDPEFICQVRALDDGVQRGPAS